MYNFVIGDRVANLADKGSRFYGLRGTVVNRADKFVTVNWGGVLLGNHKSDFLYKIGTPIVSSAASNNSVDAVNSPKHYQFFPDLEAIVVIARSMTQEQFYGYCLGNRLKYRLRAGNKDKLEQDIAKADKYLELYEQHKHECIKK